MGESHEILTFAEAAALLRVSAPTLRKAVRKGEVPARRIGREWRFLRSELMALLKSRAA